MSAAAEFMITMMVAVVVMVVVVALNRVFFVCSLLPRTSNNGIDNVSESVYVEKCTRLCLGRGKETCRVVVVEVILSVTQTHTHYSILFGE